MLVFSYSAPSAADVQFIPFGDLEGAEFSSAAEGVSRDGQVAVGVGTSTASGSGGREAQKWGALDGSVGLGSIDDNGGAYWSYARGASNDGTSIVGASRSSFSTGNSTEAFLWTAESDEMVGLGDLVGGAIRSDAYAISGDASIIVGSSSSTASGANWDEAFLWTEEGAMQALGFLGGTGGSKSASLGISSDGMVVVGESTSAESGANRREAFRWTEEGAMEALGFLDFSVAGNNTSRANAASIDGLVIVGASVSADSRSTDSVEAFRWEDDSMLALGDLAGGSFMSEALATNNTGNMIVGVSSSSAGDEAFIWDATNGMRSLKAVLEDAGIDLSNWDLTRATGISGGGLRIVGWGVNPSGNDEGWVAILPEPTSTTLGLAAVLTLAVTAGRRRERGTGTLLNV